jgi:hypothetical protein
MKKGEDDSPRLGLTDNTESGTLFLGANSTFDLTNGTADADGSIEDVGNGWYRCTLTGTAQSTSAARLFIYLNDKDTAAFNGQGFYIYGAQIEAGSFPTSYIKSNSGSTTTRSADVASIPVADFGFNDDGYSFLIEAQAPHSINTNQDTFFATLDGNSDLYMYANNTGSQGEYQLRSSGGDIVLAENNVAITGIMKVGVGFKKDNCVMTRNGAISSTDTSATLPTGVTDLLLGRSGSGGQKFVHIKSIKYYPRRLSNAQLVELTS